MQTKRDLKQTRQELAHTRLVIDLIATTGMINTRVETYVLTNGLRSKKKIILSGAPESKGKKIKSVVLTNLKSVLTK